VPSNDHNLALFHPLIARWFLDRIGRPTDVQAQAWPKIAAGEHVLITAPTGSGKTLTAFLWALHQLIAQKWQTGHTRVLYISPLKALNNDIQRNLITPLQELEAVFRKAEQPFPSIRVHTRSGDTPQSERRRMLRSPPEILITTPESLNILLSSVGGRTFFTDLATVILDEIHAVIDTKRGTHLITAVDRLVPLSGEFQRIGLSATIRPLEAVAEFIGGYRMEGSPQSPEYVPRSVCLVRSELTKKYDINIRSPEEEIENGSPESFWKPLIAEFKKIIGKNRSTLFFTNVRNLAEKTTLRTNLDEAQPVAYAHHGSLSREVRTAVENKMKSGELKAIVATNSLELGIDIGALDEVVLIQSPPSISAAIQRVGRAGHHVGEVSRGTLFPTHSHDFLEAAVLAPAILTQDIEEVHPIRCPLDVLAQIILSMVGIQVWDIDALYAQLKTSAPYRHLSRQHFDLILNMLAGRYADTRIRDLRPRVSIDRLDNTVAAKKGALLALYTSGGMIPDRGYFHLRHHDSGSRIGELDEEFVWEASVGQTFTLGTQNWKIQRITHNDVFVVPGSPTAGATPFWKGESFDRDFHYSRKISDFLETSDERLDDPEFPKTLQDDHCMDERSADRLIHYLKRQREFTDSSLPHRHHLLVEHVSSGPGGVPGHQVVLHTVWGGRVNRPFAMALAAAWETRYHQHLEVYSGNDCIVLLLPHDTDGDELISLVTGKTVESLLRKHLEGSGFFGARFRESAGRALLITRSSMNRRTPLWMSRLRSQKLLNTVMQYDDFPILLEAWRTCLQDHFDLDALRLILTEIESGIIHISEAFTTHPSPMAQDITWRQINEYMYASDALDSAETSRLRGDLLRDVVLTPGLRPTISADTVARFLQKRQRLFPGYAPSTARDLVDWVKERLLIPQTEWNALMQALQRDHPDEAREVRESALPKLVKILPGSAREPLFVSLEELGRIVSILYEGPDRVRMEAMDSKQTTFGLSEKSSVIPNEDEESLRTDLIGQWLQFYGPKSAAFIQETLGIEKPVLALSLEDLSDAQRIISGRLVTDRPEDDICDAENFEILLRMARSEAVPSFEPLAIQRLPLSLAAYQGLVDTQQDIDGLFRRIEQLRCYGAPAAAWEADILPARLHPYNATWLDTILHEGDLRWIGSEKQNVCFCFESDFDLMQCEVDAPPSGETMDQDETGDDSGQKKESEDVDRLFKDPSGRYDFSTLLQITGNRPSHLSDRLWNGVWQGRITSDAFSALRKGIVTRFKLPELTHMDRRMHIRSRRSGSRARFSQWKGSLPYAGNWFLVDRPSLDDDLLSVEERNKDRVRVLLDRYGILFRELLQRESYPFQWPRVFRSLRLMELSGEILSGYFFQNIPGPQFISPRAFRMLQKKMPSDTVWWMNATDPASCCGLPIDGLRGNLPRRVDSTHIVYRGDNLVLLSMKHGKELTFRVPPNDDRIQEYLIVLNHLLSRTFRPRRRITVEIINGEPAAKSEYADVLRTHFETMVDYKNITLYRNVEG